MIEPRCSHMTQSFIRWFNVYFCVYLLNGCYMPGSVLQARCKPGGNCCSCGTHILHALEQKQKQVTNQQVKCKEHKGCQMVIRTKKNNNKAEKKERECTVLKQREKIFLRRFPFYRSRNWDSQEHCSMILTSVHQSSPHSCWCRALHCPCQATSRSQRAEYATLV